MSVEKRDYSAPLPPLPDASPHAPKKGVKGRADQTVAHVVQKALPKTPDDLLSESEKAARKEARAATLASPLPPTPKKLTPREIKKFVVVTRNGKEVLKHHSALTLTEKIAAKLKKNVASPILQTNTSESLAALVLDLRKALKTKNEGQLQKLLTNTPPHLCAKAYEMLALTEEDLALIQKVLFPEKKQAVPSAKEKHALAIEEKKLQVTLQTQLSTLSALPRLQALASTCINGNAVDRETTIEEIAAILKSDPEARLMLQANARSLFDTLEAVYKNTREQLTLLPKDKQLSTTLAKIEQQREGAHILIQLTNAR